LDEAGVPLPGTLTPRVVVSREFSSSPNLGRGERVIALSAPASILSGARPTPPPTGPHPYTERMARIKPRYKKKGGKKTLTGYVAVFYAPDRHPKEKSVTLRTPDRAAARRKLTEYERRYS